MTTSTVPVTIPETDSTKEILAYQGPGGYHPCSRETYFKLKLLKKAFWQAVRKQADWFRWHAKTVNRQGPEPVRVRLFGLANSRDQRTKWHPKAAFPNSNACADREHGTHRRLMGVADHLTDRGVLRACLEAKHPKQDPRDVRPLSLSETDIDRLLAALQEQILEGLVLG